MKEILGIKYYSIPEVAEILCISIPTVRNYIKNKIIGYTKFRRDIMISEKNINDYINLRTVNANPPPE